MKKVISLIIAVTLLGLIAGEVSAQSVCYRWTNGTFFDGTNCVPVSFDEVYKLDIKKHSRLSTLSEQNAFGHPKQVVYSVHGKHVFLGEIVRPVVGTLHAIGTFLNPSTKAGEHRMGLETFVTTGCPNFIKDVEISCKSTGEGFPPQSWHCYGQNKWGDEFEFDLVKVDPATDRDCCAFEYGIDAFAEEKVKGPASASKMK